MAGDKSEARTRGSAARAALTEAERVAAARGVAERALGIEAVRDARTVLAYAAMPFELDPSPLVDALRGRGARIAYPRVTGPGSLQLHWCEDASALSTGYCGIAEPSCEAPEADIVDIDLVLVPGAAFDERCGRLGMGGGFYDRLLPGLRDGALAVGLAFDEQVVDEVPIEHHDAALGAVLTPTRTILPRA